MKSISNLTRVIALLLVCIFLFSSCTFPENNNTKETETATAETTESKGFDPEEDLSFDEFVKEILLSFLGDSIDTWNAIALDPANLGYVRGENVKAEFATYTSDYCTTEAQETVTFCDEALEYLHKYDYSSLTESQKYEYDTIEYQLEMNRKAFDAENSWILLTAPTYISQYGGKVDDFSSTIQNYNLRCEQDVIDVIDFVKSTKTAFASYITYGEDRITQEFPLSDETLSDMRTYLDKIIQAGEEYVLFSVGKNKIEECSFLSEQQKNQYVDEFTVAMKDIFLPAVEDLYQGLASLMGNWKNVSEGELSHYGTKAEGYYSWKLCYTLGLESVNLQTYATKLYNEYVNAYMSYSSLMQEIAAKSSDFQTEFDERLNSTEAFFGAKTAEEVVEILKKTADFVVTPLSYNPEILVQYVDEISAASASYIAYYRLSPYDEKNTALEKIYLNPLSAQSLNDSIFTLAHEGYPGHLYAHVLAKEADLPAICSIFSSLGASEGWAQYAAYSVLMAYSESTVDEVESYIAQLIATMTYLNYIYSAYLDVLVNGLNQTVSDLCSLGMTNADALSAVRSVDEIPASMAAYGFGFSQMLYNHQRVSSQCKKGTTQEYNTYLITHNGLFGLAALEKVTVAYINAHQ